MKHEHYWLTLMLLDPGLTIEEARRDSAAFNYKLHFLRKLQPPRPKQRPISRHARRPEPAPEAALHRESAPILV